MTVFILNIDPSICPFHYSLFLLTWLCLHVALSGYIVYFLFWFRLYVQMLPSPVQDFESQLVTKINAVIL